MIFSFNTLGFYSVKVNRQYDNTDNKKFIHHFETNKIPAFQIILDSTITTATYKLYDVDDNEISNGSVTVENDTNDAGTAFSRLIFLGTTLSSKDDGFYYIEITYDGSFIYSDVFCWQTDISGYLKISATTANMAIGGFKMNMDSFTYLIYFDADNLTEEFEVKEEGVERTYGDEPYYNSRNHVVEYIISGYRKTYNFIAGLRTVSTNGTVTITFDSETYEIYDIETPEKTSAYSNSDILILSWKFKLKDYLQVRNEV